MELWQAHNSERPIRTQHQVNSMHRLEAALKATMHMLDVMRYNLHFNFIYSFTCQKFYVAELSRL